MRQVNDPVLEGHDIGNRRCGACVRGFPKPCAECGGLVHAVRENIEGDGVVMVSECEECGARPE